MRTIIKQLQTLSFFNTLTIVNVTPITSGLSQHSFKVKCENNTYYAKYFSDNNERFAQIERDVLTSTSKLALTLPLLYSDDQWLITPYIEINDLAHSSISLKNKLAISVELLLRFQTLPISSTAIKPLNITSLIDSFLDTLPINESDKVTFKDVVFSLIPEQKLPLVLCHGDLNFTNIVSKNSAFNQAQLIDFECCCYAETEYDIAMMIAGNNLLELMTLESVFYHISDVFINNKVSFNNKKVTRYVFICLIINCLWYLERFLKTKAVKWQQLAIKQFSQADSLKLTNFSCIQALKNNL